MDEDGGLTFGNSPTPLLDSLTVESVAHSMRVLDAVGYDSQKFSRNNKSMNVVIQDRNSTHASNISTARHRIIVL